MSSTVLKRFDLTPSGDAHTFGGECIQAAAAIDRIYRTLTYDHRPWLDSHEENLDAKRTEEYRIGYACFKYAVARVLCPHRIVEIGVGSGVAAIAFAMADNHAHTLSDGAHYIGLDSGEWEDRLGHNFLKAVDDKLNALQVEHQLVRGDSRDVDCLPECDLVHVDGDHSMEAVRHDVAIAWKSGAKWILCDDARDPAVVAGTFQALSLDLNRGCVEWAYFGDSWTGNLLIRTDHRKKEE